MTDDQLLRYSRHILLDEVGVEGQQRLLDAHALIIGAGGLGSPVALYLAASGVGHITVVDHDLVDLTNLQRQIAHTTERVGQAKAHSAALAMRALNPEVQVHALTERADAHLYLAKEGGRNRFSLEAEALSMVSAEEKGMLFSASNLSPFDADGHAPTTDSE